MSFDNINVGSDRTNTSVKTLKSIGPTFAAKFCLATSLIELNASSFSKSLSSGRFKTNPFFKEFIFPFLKADSLSSNKEIII